MAPTLQLNTIHYYQILLSGKKKMKIKACVLQFFKLKINLNYINCDILV